MILTGEIEEPGEKPIPVQLSTTYLTQTNMGGNLGLRGDRPVTNRLSHE